MVDDLVAKYPGYNVMVVAVNWKIRGYFIKQHVRCTYALGTSTGYGVFLIRQGDYAYFERLGDGGWINWAFTCPPQHCRRQDHIVTWF
jgi:hypothetical protein